MRKIKEYTLIGGDRDGNHNILIDNVNYMIKEGWQPLGAPFPRLTGRGSSHPFQAMVKYEEGVLNE